MWQSMVNNMLQRMHQDDAKVENLQDTLLKIASCADFMMEEMERRFPNSDIKPNPAGGFMPAPNRPTIHVKR
jgi:hypothetical protein